MTSLEDAITTTPVESESETTNIQSEVDGTESNHSSASSSSYEQLNCQTCKKDYTDHEEFYQHISTHVTQPKVVLQRIDDPQIRKNAQNHKCGPLKFTVKSTNNNFQIVKSPTPTPTNDEIVDESNYPRVPKLRILLPEQISEVIREKSKSPKETETVCNGETEKGNMVELKSLPNESQSPGFPTQSPARPEIMNNEDHNSFWSSDQPTEDPLQLPQSGEKEAETHNDLLQNFLNDSVSSAAKDSLLNSNETEYISLEHLAEKNGPYCPVCRERCRDQPSLEIHQKAMGHYLPINSTSSSSSLIPYGQPSLSSSLQASSLNSLANLPMQQLAQQVNRLQQGQVHQQNVLINIQQFGQPMASPQYGRPPDMPPSHYPGPGQHYPGQQPQHMYPGYHHPPPPPPHHPMYYPPTSGMYPVVSQAHHFAPPAPPAPPRMIPPRAPAPPPQRMAPPPPQRMAPPPPPAQTQIRYRQRMPNQPRGNAPRMQPPRSTNPNIRPNIPQQIRPQRRAAPPTDQNTKRKRLDVFLPDTNDNDDCHVISMQKCNDGLPIIKNVQGATTSSEIDPVVHLTDSITLSVRNPKDSPVTQQKKSDAKAVANILATRGITVTPAAKSAKESATIEPAKRIAQKSTSPPVAINLNNAVSIIPTARNNLGNSAQQQKETNRPPRPPTVDLTDDEPVQQTQKGPATVNKRTLPYHCDLCPAQYPSLQSLQHHQRSYHKIGIQNELGIPIVDLKQTAVLSKLANIGIHNYIPLPQLGSGKGTFGMPIVSLNAARNPNICNIGAIGSGAVLPLGPLRHISNSNNGKQS